MSPPVLFSEQPTLRGTLCTLRPFTAGDIDAMGPILADPEVLRLTGSVHSTGEAEAGTRTLDERTRRWYDTRSGQDDRLDLAVVDNATGGCVGEAVLNEWAPEDDACNFRILLGPVGRDRGIGSEATRLLIDHAFTATGLHRISLEVFAFNPRARRAYEKSGFTAEGTLRGAFKFDGRYIDAIAMSILRPEWERAGGVADQRGGSAG
ncbi:GNAT family N-acetyltransferase [Arthrobacter sp. TMN-37]